MRDKIKKIIAIDPRYAAEAYYFVLQAYEHAAEKMFPEAPQQEGRPNLSGAQLLEGIRSLALEQFGFMAATVLRKWGIKSSEDIGEIVFNMVEHGGMNKSPEDSKEDFAGGTAFVDSLQNDYDFSKLQYDFNIGWDSEAWNIATA